MKNSLRWAKTGDRSKENGPRYLSGGILGLSA